MISNLEVNLQKNPLEREDISREIDLLKTKKNEILTNPDVLGLSIYVFSNEVAKTSPIDFAKSAKITKAKNVVAKPAPSLRTLDGKPVPPSDNINCFATTMPTTSTYGGVSSVNSRPVTAEILNTPQPSPSIQKNAFNALIEIASEPQIHDFSKKSEVLFVPSFNMPMTTFVQRPISIPVRENNVELPAFRWHEDADKKPMLPVLEPQKTSPTTSLISQPTVNMQWSLPSIQLPEWFDAERKKFSERL